MKKIINIIIFTVAGLACLLALIFVGVYQDDKAIFDEVSLVKERTPQAVDDLLAVSQETLPKYIATYQEVASKEAATLKEKQLPKDILYTYISNLKEVTAESFPEFKSNFPHYADVLFAKSDQKQKYVDGFNKVNKFEELSAYIATLSNEYVPIKQAYLKDKDYLKALNSIVGRAQIITESVSQNKQISQIEELKDAISSASKSGNILNFAIVFFYVALFAAILLTVLFALLQIFANIKHSYQVFIGIAIIALLLVVAYFISPSELTKSAIKMQHTPSEMKFIGAGVITCYAALFGAVLSIVVNWIINIFKKV